MWISLQRIQTIDRVELRRSERRKGVIYNSCRIILRQLTEIIVSTFCEKHVIFQTSSVFPLFIALFLRKLDTKSYTSLAIYYPNSWNCANSSKSTLLLGCEIFFAWLGSFACLRLKTIRISKFKNALSIKQDYFILIREQTFYIFTKKWHLLKWKCINEMIMELLLKIILKYVDT